MFKKNKKQVKRLLPKKAEIIEDDEYEDEEETEEEEYEEDEEPVRPQKKKKRPSEPVELRNQEVLDVIEGNINRALSALQFLRNKV